MLIVPSNSVSGSRTAGRGVPCTEYVSASNVVGVIPACCCVTGRSSSTLLADDDDPVLGTGDCAADVEKVTLGIDALDTQMRLRMLLRAVVPRHALPLDDARRIRSRPDRTGPAVLRVAVRVRPSAEAVALHHALEPAAFRRAGDLDGITDGEDADIHMVAHLVRRNLGIGTRSVVETHAAQHARRHLEPGLGGVPHGRARRAAAARRALTLRVVAARPLLAVAELDLRHAVRRLV